MSKLTTRVVLSTLISLGIVVGIYTSVQGASLWANKAGSHLVSGAMVNLDHYRATVQQGSFGSQSDLFSKDGKGEGHGCSSESPNSSSDL